MSEYARNHSCHECTEYEQRLFRKVFPSSIAVAEPEKRPSPSSEHKILIQGLGYVTH